MEATPLRQDTLPVNGFNREEPMKFTGHERDFSIGTSSENSNYIDYMHARSTVPQWGRFLSVDPGGYLPTRPQSWNRYAYVENNPIGRTDPNGKECPPCIEEAINGAGTLIAMGTPITYMSAYNEAVLDAIAPPSRAMNGEIQPTYAEFGIVAPFVPGPGSGAARTAETLFEGAAKSDVLQAIRGGAGEMTAAQRATLIRQIQRATTKEAVSVVRNPNGALTVLKTRPGFDGSQTMVTQISKGGTSTVVQTATNAQGKLVHYDPKRTWFDVFVSWLK